MFEEKVEGKRRTDEGYDREEEEAKVMKRLEKEKEEAEEEKREIFAAITEAMKKVVYLETLATKLDEYVSEEEQYEKRSRLLGRIVVIFERDIAFITETKRRENGYLRKYRSHFYNGLPDHEREFYEKFLRVFRPDGRKNDLENVLAKLRHKIRTEDEDYRLRNFKMGTVTPAEARAEARAATRFAAARRKADAKAFYDTVSVDKSKFIPVGPTKTFVLRHPNLEMRPDLEDTDRGRPADMFFGSGVYGLGYYKDTSAANLAAETANLLL